MRGRPVGKEKLFKQALLQELNECFQAPDGSKIDRAVPRKSGYQALIGVLQHGVR